MERHPGRRHATSSASIGPPAAWRRRRNPRLAWALALTLVLTAAPEGALGAIPTEPSSESVEAEVAATVHSFNAAVTARDPDAVAAHFAEGAVQLSSRPAHAGIGESAALAGDAVAQWKAIASLLQGGTRAYERTAENLEVRVEGDLATVWCTIRTETVPLDGGAPSGLDFRETYTLFRTADGWKIAALANTRPTR